MILFVLIVHCQTLQAFTYTSSDCTGIPYISVISITEYISSTGLDFGSSYCND